MAEFTPNFNLKKPNEDEFYNIDDFNGNMDIIDKKLKEAGQSEQLQTDVTEIKNDIGSPSDISSSPTIFGKLAEIKETLTTKFNEVISKITDSISENKKVVGSPEDISTSPTIFGKLAEIKETLTTKFSEIISKITNIDSKIGTTTDTGGTSSAGGIFAKLNKLLTDWTTTRASRIDSIYTATTTNNTASTTGTLSQKLSSVISTLSSILTNTSSSTTSSSTGTLSQKLNYLKSLLENTTYGLNALKNLISINKEIKGVSVLNISKSSSFYLNGSEYYCIIGKFIAPVTGKYKLTLTGEISDNSGNSTYNLSKLFEKKEDGFGLDYIYETEENWAVLSDEYLSTIGHRVLNSFKRDEVKTSISINFYANMGEIIVLTLKSSNTGSLRTQILNLTTKVEY